MKIVIKNIKFINDTILTDFECSAGTGSAIWGTKWDPTIGDIYDVEFELDGLFENHLKRILDDIANYSLFTKGDNQIFEGIVDGIDDDGLVYLRLSTDGLVMIEADKPTVETGNWVQLQYSPFEVEIYPIGSSVA